MDAPKRSRIAATVAGLSCLGFALLGRSAEPPSSGSWQSHVVSFPYMGDVTNGVIYSCDGLEDDLTYLLKRAGARLNAPVRVTPCFHGSGQPSTLLTAQLSFATFVPSSAEASPASQQAAGWRQVEFSGARSYPSLQMGSCELVSEFRESLLKYFATRAVKASLNCIPFQPTLWGLSFETLEPSAAGAR